MNSLFSLAFSSTETAPNSLLNNTVRKSYGLLSKQSGYFCLLTYFRPIPHALFLCLSGKVKAKIVLAKEFWAKSRIAPSPPRPIWDRRSADKTTFREASISGFKLRNFLCLSLFGPHPFFHLRPGLRHTFADF